MCSQTVAPNHRAFSPGGDDIIATSLSWNFFVLQAMISYEIFSFDFNFHENILWDPYASLQQQEDPA